MVRRIDRAEDHFQQTYPDQSEDPGSKGAGLGFIWRRAASRSQFRFATDHLQRNGADFEAYNLLIKGHFLSGRYEAGENLADTVLAAMQGARNVNDCFETNRSSAVF